MQADDPAKLTWWTWSGTAVRPLTDPDSEPSDSVVLSGPVSASEADATRAFMRWFQLLRMGQPVDGVGAGLGDGWGVRPLRDAAGRPHDPFAWDGRDVALANLTACRTIEDLEALGNLLPVARTLFGDRATRPLARALAEAVFESMARGQTTFSAIRLATAATPLFPSEQLAQMLSWDDSGELVVPAGQIRVLADDLRVLFGDIRSQRRRLALVEGAWEHAVALGAVATDINTNLIKLADRRRLSVASCVGYLERVAVGETDELREVVANLLLREIETAKKEQRPVTPWRLTGLVRDHARETVSKAELGRRALLRAADKPAPLRNEECRILADTVVEMVQNHPWLQVDWLTRAIGEDWRRQLERDERRLWSQMVHDAARAKDPGLVMPWMIDRWPEDLVSLIALVANHHRLTRATVSASSSRARTWASFARDVSSFELGDLAVPDEAWVSELDGTTIGDLTVSVARSSQTLLQWSEYMRNCIYSGYLSDAVEGLFVFVALSEPDGALRYNASIVPDSGRVWEIAARFNERAPDEVSASLEHLVLSLRNRERGDPTPTDHEAPELLDVVPARPRPGPRGGARRKITEARRAIAIVEADLQKERTDREKAMELLSDLGEVLGLRRSGWRLTVRRLDHVDDERLSEALAALGSTPARRAQRKAFLDWDPLDEIAAPEPLADLLALVRAGDDEAELTRPIRVLRPLELRTRWLLARLQRRVVALTAPAV